MEFDFDQALSDIPDRVRHALLEEFGELESRFAKRDWGPAELNGGRFAEAILRYLEWKHSGSFTPFGQQLNRSAIVGRVRSATGLPDGIRFHVTSCAELLMDVRNKRDVAHLGDAVDVKGMDAHLVMRLAAWALSEIVREESGLPSSEVQYAVDRLSERRLALVEEIDGHEIVVATDLPAVQRALVALYHRYPSRITLTDLKSAVQYQNASRLRSLMADRVRNAIVHIDDNGYRLTAKGAQWVERNIDMRLEI